jgi:hypothetical protein
MRDTGMRVGFRIQGLESRVKVQKSLRFRIQDFEVRDKGLGFRVQGSEFRLSV